MDTDRRRVECDGTYIDIVVSRFGRRGRYILEIVAADGHRTLFTHEFPSAEDAFDAATAAVKGDGFHSFFWDRPNEIE